MVWRKDDEKLHPDCINYRKRPSAVGMMFWGAFRMGKMGPGLIFEPDAGKHISSTVLTGPFNDFWWEAFGDVTMLHLIKRCVFLFGKDLEWWFINTPQTRLI